MRAILSAPYVDARAGDLGWALDLRPLPALATLRLGPVELRVLGSSHQVLAPGVGEIVACAHGAVLPAQAEVPLPGGIYRIRTQVSRPAALERVVATLDRLAAADDVLLARFGDDPLAVTVLEARSARAWRSWHVYPQSGEVVATSSSVARGRR